METEQILQELSNHPQYLPHCSSYVQVRGSAPVFWFQEPSIYIAKPQIQSKESIVTLILLVNERDPNCFATKKHVCDLYSRYGSRIFVINLVRQIEKQEREVILTRKFR